MKKIKEAYRKIKSKTVKFDYSDILAVIIVILIILLVVSLTS